MILSTCRLTTVVLDFGVCGKLTVADVSKLGEVLSQCPALEHLELMAITFDRTNAAAFDVVARGLTQCTSLTHLRCQDIMMTAGATHCLAGALGQCPVLSHLDLSGSDVGALVTRDVAREEVFVSHGETLWKTGGAGVCAILARGLMKSPWLAEINLSLNQIGPAGAESLPDVLGQCPALVKLDLHTNDIECRGTESLVGVETTSKGVCPRYLIRVRSVGP